MIQRIKLIAIVSKNHVGQRLDKFLAESFPNYSRSLIKKYILNQQVLINNNIWDKPKKKILDGETIIINADIKEKVHLKPQAIKLNIIYEDNDIIIINKPSNMVVHPGAGNFQGTILNALLNHYPSIINVPRAGIVHRLDKDTTGLMVIAKTIPAYIRLVKSLKLHEITREYEAIVVGCITKNGTIKQPIGRHPTKRTKMSVNNKGKPAITHYRVIENFREHTRLRLRLETGRTHQIRVHMSHIAHSLVGDQLYGNTCKYPKGASKDFITLLCDFNRQALHSIILRFYHPINGIEMNWYAPIPHDMLKLIKAMHTDFEENTINRL